MQNLNDNNENDVFMAAFEPLATAGRRSAKRRSSILKTIEANYGCGEERRVSRRVSWAHTYQYKEVLADGTAVIKCQELNGLKTDDVMLPPPPPSTTISAITDSDLIKSSDFINTLKAKSKSRSSTSGVTVESIAEEVVTDVSITSTTVASKRSKRAKKNASKGLSKYLAKHYDVGDEDDVATVLNTSYNKYGRQLKPITNGQSIDFTQLFTDDNNDMELTFDGSQEMTAAIGPHDGPNTTTTTDMSMTLNQTGIASMSLCDTTSVSHVQQETQCFSDESIDITDCQSAMNTSSYHLVGALDSSDGSESDKCVDITDQLATYAAVTQSDGHNTNTAAQDMEITNCVEITNQLIIESPVANCDDQTPSDDNMQMTNCNDVTNQLTSNVSDADCHHQNSSINNMEMTNCVDITNQLAIGVPVADCDDQNSSADDMEMTNCVEIINPLTIAFSVATDQNPSANNMELTTCVDITNQLAIDVPVVDCDDKNPSTDDMEMTNCVEIINPLTTTVPVANDQNPSANNMELTNCVDITNQSAIDVTVADCDDQNTSPDKSLDSTQNKPLNKPKVDPLYALSKPLMATPNAQLERTGRLNLSKSVFKSFGFDITERLRHKKNELEAKRRQSAVTTGLKDALNESQHQKVVTTVAANEPEPVLSANVETTNVSIGLDSKRQRSVMTTDLKDEPDVKRQRNVLSMVESDEDEDKHQQSVPTIDNNTEPEAKQSANVTATDLIDELDTNHCIVSTEANSKYESRSDPSSLSIDLFGLKSNVEDNQDMDVDDMETSTKSVPQKSSHSVVAEKSDVICEESKSDTKSDSQSDSSTDSVTVETTVPSKDDESCESSSDSSTISSAESLSTSSLNLNSTSPLSVSMIHSSGDYLVSSPTAMEKTLNFTFNEDLSDDSQSFDPFIHTNRSFHTNTTFYESTSPLQLSFMVRDDTLCILADELERQIEDIVLPDDDHNVDIEMVTSTDEPKDLYEPLRRLDAKQMGFTYELMADDKAIISYLWGTFALEVRFGDLIDDPTVPFTVRHIVAINMKSLVSADEPLKMRQKGLRLKFHDFHKPLITVAHDLIISSFETEEQHIKGKHKTSASLDELVSYISLRVMSAKRLLSELRIISSSEICRLYPKTDGTYRLVIEILALRKPIYLVLPINAKSYPDEVIHPKVKIPAEDKQFYCMDQFSAAFLRIECRQFDYIRRLIRATKAFIRAKKRLIYEKQKNMKQMQEIGSQSQTLPVLNTHS